MPSHLQDACRPLLKWAGGKRQLLPFIREYYPSGFSRYFEPFLGSGAVFFDLAGSGRLDGRPAVLSDCNQDLIGCYEAVRDEPAAVTGALMELAGRHALCPDFYYEVRDQRFNPARAAGASPRTPEMAAMLIYLNRTGFNGLFRVNRRGAFNVPAGRYASPRICDPARITQVSRVLRAPGVSLDVAAFDAQLDRAQAGDFIYCDPPYAPLSPTASFAHYTAGGFGEADQLRLRHSLIAASQRGAFIVLSNSSAPIILGLFGSSEAADAGLIMRRVPARRAINSRASLRGPVDELLVSNVVASRLAIRPRMARARLAPAALRRQA
ncbi:MAG: Dam family site-specific DNA-(adenine-N6)-methyltransferase [Vicinamibacterales bacterium]|nr:Dam family site-specific DNA-(adenine-N6)-methyltransferase [Vicinamibacterales bacterium]